MYRQPDSVAGAVHEIFGKPGLGEHVAGRGVDLFGGDAGAHRGDPGGLGALQHRVLPGDPALGSPRL